MADRFKKSSGGWRVVDHPDPLLGVQFTKRRLDGVVLTRATGRITLVNVDAWTRDFNALGGGEVWIFNALDATSYAPDAVVGAVKSFTQAHAKGLRTIVAAIRSPVVRMGARAVSLSLMIATGVGVVVVDSMLEADEAATKR